MIFLEYYLFILLVNDFLLFLSGVYFFFGLLFNLPIEQFLFFLFKARNVLVFLIEIEELILLTEFNFTLFKFEYALLFI